MLVTFSFPPTTRCVARIIRCSFAYLSTAVVQAQCVQHYKLCHRMQFTLRTFCLFLYSFLICLISRLDRVCYSGIHFSDWFCFIKKKKTNGRPKSVRTMILNRTPRSFGILQFWHVFIFFIHNFQ